MIQEILDLFRQDFIVEAYRKLKEYEATNPDLEELNAVPEIDELRKDVVYINEALGLLGNFDEWNLVKEKDDICTFYKGSGNLFFVRGELILNCEMLPVIALFSETDLFGSWMKQISAFTQVGDPSPYRRL